MKGAIRGIIGKEIEHVLVKAGPGSPRSQVFLVFTDGTYYELYCCDDEIRGAGGLDPGGLEAARRYMPERDIVLEA